MHTSEGHLKDLVQLLLAQGLLAYDQVYGKEEHQKPMPNVSEHDGKQEGECYDGEHGGIDLPIASNPIGMHNLLEAAVDLVGLKVGWRSFVCHQGLKDRSDLYDN